MFDYLFKRRCAKALAPNSLGSSAYLSEPLQLIGRGSGRLCYEHPTDKNLCIKIARASRGDNESRREFFYIKLIRFIHRENVEQHLTKFHGRICTTAGTGWVVERVMDDVGVSASPLMHECLTPAAFDAESEQWKDAFNEFMQWCGNTSVVVRDASVNNICVKRLDNGQLRFVLIDGIGPKGVLARLFPTKKYAQERNLAYASASEFTSIENLVVFCEKLRSDLRYHRDTVVDEPLTGVRCVLSRLAC